MNSNYLIFRIILLDLFVCLIKQRYFLILIGRAILINFNNMPQLIPFYFINQLSFSFLSLLALIYVVSKYILPLFTYTQVIRMYITKLSNKA